MGTLVTLVQTDERNLSPVHSLEKYIRADKLEVAQKLARKNYQYFK